MKRKKNNLLQLAVAAIDFAEWKVAVRKLIMFSVLLCASIIKSYAHEIETQATATGADKNIDAVGVSYTLPGLYIAGKGSTQAGTMTSKGLKLRTKQNGGKIVFNVNKSYTITSLTIDAVGQYVADDSNIPYVKVTEVLVDGTSVDFEGGQFPEKGAGISGILTINNIRASQQVEIMFDNTNASAGTQVSACYEITYEEAEADKPTITLSPNTINLVPGASYQIQSSITPSYYRKDCSWYAGSKEGFINNGGISPYNNIVGIDENGIIIAKSPGTIPVKCIWLGATSIEEDSVTVIVNDFYPSEHRVVKTWNFTAMGDVTLTIGGEVYQIWNDANNQCSGAQFCLNEGLEQLAFQAVIGESNKRGWQIVDGLGLYLTGDGRCAAVGKLKTGQYVEFVYTGSKFATKDYTMDLNLGPDAGAAKKAISEELNHAIYQVQNKNGATEDLIIGFEIGTGNYIKSITIYDIEDSNNPNPLPSGSNVVKAIDLSSLKGGKVTLPISMSNENSITAFQFELALPNGVTIESAALTSRKSNQTLSYSKLANGNYQLVAFSSDSRAFSGNDGELVRVQLKVGDAVAAGDYTIEVKNIELTTTDEKSCNPADCSATLTVSDVQLGDANGDGKISITDAVAVVNKLLGKPSANFNANAADVNGDGRITITDAVAIVNIVLGKRPANARVREPQ